MDLRIVNTCDNNCLYCLENSLRNKDKYISKDFVFAEIEKENNLENITFYGGNPLLHPDLLEIVKYCNDKGFKSIGLLSNTNRLTKDYLNELILNGLSTFGFYFNSFNKENHQKVNGNGVPYEKLIKNLQLLSDTHINKKLIIHVNKLNIGTIARDLYILKEKYGFSNIDFVNYFPFDKPYQNRADLDYCIDENRENIDLIFKIIKKLNLSVNFVKFDRKFFGENKQYYDFHKGILNQIGEEDIERLSKENPFCLEEKRCRSCFIKDSCKFYGL